jgi:hypothetical protein
MHNAMAAASFFFVGLLFARAGSSDIDKKHSRQLGLCMR